MKANVPEKIYIEVTSDDYNRDVVKEERTENTDIEYIRADSFIEKLECWMNENFYQYAGEFAEGILAQFDRTEYAIDSFRKYMKGE